MFLQKCFKTFLLGMLAVCTSADIASSSPPRLRRAASSDWVTISFEDFEDGIGKWESGGPDSKRVTDSTYAHSGKASLRLRDNSGRKSSASLRQSFSAEEYDELRVTFWFITKGFNQTWKAFYLDISNDGGSSWERVKEWDYKRQFENDIFYKKTKIIDAESYKFTNNMKFRFKCDAGNDTDQVFFDDIKISGRTTSGGSGAVTYEPGELRSSSQDPHGIRWSKGLSGKRLTRTGEKVVYRDGSRSSKDFHTDPDAGACFPLKDGSGGWVYVSNSEDTSGDISGGVGALYFDSKGRVVRYDRILDNTDNNCGGGKSPWNTWLTVSRDPMSSDAFTRLRL
jgi:hypothetical protein